MRLLTTALLTLSLLPSSALATSIAVVDEKVFEKAKVIQHINDQMQKKRDEFQKEVKKKETELKKEDEALSKQKADLSENAFKQKAKDFRNRFAEAQSLLQMRRTQLENGYVATTKRVQEELRGIIAEIAKEKKFDVALPKNFLLYSSDSLDISKEVLAKLDKKLPKLKLIMEDAPKKKQ